MRINKNQLHRFKRVKKGYIYPISSGVYLSFNEKLEYIGVEMFYGFSYKKIDRIAEEKLEELIAKDLIEVGE